ncbi:14443_t:CDS:2 [Gigaspora margarita]|uniref:14443_t:CDS:1 n=1 Tax=Gigaspora margarita TaxID=4874 RepID=A0ABN7VH34_GIGMA|nr:14443_t:CDS:2 [Gigaspora margarita]
MYAYVNNDGHNTTQVIKQTFSKKEFKLGNSNDDEYLTESDDNVKENHKKIVKQKEWSTIAHSLLSPESDDFSLQIKFQNNSICLDLGDNERSINFDEHQFNFQDNFESIINELKIWKRIDSTLELVNAEVTYFRIRHYLILFDAYTALFKQARKDTPGEYKNYSIREKIENGIPLGQDANSVRNRKWVRFQIKSILKLKATKSEERKYNASWRIKFLVDNCITTIKKLVKAGASPRFFETITFAEFDLFLNTITDGKHKKLSIPVEIDDTNACFEPFVVKSN